MDVATYKLVVVFLGCLCLSCLGGIIWLDSIGHAPPAAILVAFGSAVGSLTTLVTTPRQPEQPPQQPPAGGGPTVHVG